MSIHERLKLTSFKIHEDLLENYKLDNIRTGFSMQRLCNRAVHLFLTDEDFKKRILSHNVLVTSGSL